MLDQVEQSRVVHSDRGGFEGVRGELLREQFLSCDEKFLVVLNQWVGIARKSQYRVMVAAVQRGVREEEGSRNERCNRRARPVPFGRKADPK